MNEAPDFFENLYDMDTIPAPGSGELLVEDRYEPMFFTADWIIYANITVGNSLKASWRSRSAGEARLPEEIAQWTRALIRKEMKTMLNLGVDIVTEYRKFGGNEGDFLIG